jgi:hypothetical protein
MKVKSVGTSEWGLFLLESAGSLFIQKPNLTYCQPFLSFFNILLRRGMFCASGSG